MSFPPQSTNQEQVRGAVFIMPKADERKRDTSVNSALLNQDCACQTVLKCGTKK